MIEKTFQNDDNEQDEDVFLTITCNMKRYWMRKFVSFLARIEHDGVIGHSEHIDFFADGDGTFRPKFVVEKSIRHGRWISGRGFYPHTCSICGEYQDKCYYYCPNCGAKMDEEVKEK